MEWRRVKHEETGISCMVGRLTWRQKPLVAAMVADAFKALALAGLTSGSEEELERKLLNDGASAVGLVQGCLNSLDDAVLRPIFESNVCDVEGLKGVTSGTQLLEEAPDVGFMIWLLRQLVKDATLSDEEGKASGSPSMSSSEATASSGSHATSTGPGGGPSRSTATEIRTPAALSSQVA